MSQQAAISFLVRVRDDTELQATMRKLNPTDMDKMLEIAVAYGHPPFSRDEYFAAAKLIGGEWLQWATAMRRGSNILPELSDQDLEQISGGKYSASYDTKPENTCPTCGAPIMC